MRSYSPYQLRMKPTCSQDLFSIVTSNHTPELLIILYKGPRQNRQVCGEIPNMDESLCRKYLMYLVEVGLVKRSEDKMYSLTDSGRRFAEMFIGIMDVAYEEVRKIDLSKSNVPNKGQGAMP